VNYQERSRQIIAEMRDLSTKNAAEIRDAVETGKQRLAQLVASGQAMDLVAPRTVPLMERSPRR